MGKSRSHREETRKSDSRSKGRGRTLASKVGVSPSTLSRKIAKVREEDPSLTSAQAAGKAAGILRHRKG